MRGYTPGHLGDYLAGVGVLSAAATVWPGVRGCWRDGDFVLLDVGLDRERVEASLLHWRPRPYARWWASHQKIDTKAKTDGNVWAGRNIASDEASKLLDAHATGFDPMMGFYHQPRFGRPALALDLMEPFRPLIVDSAVVTAINTKMVTPRDFIGVGETVSLTAEGRKGFYRAYELRMDTLVTHPVFGYRVSYTRLLEVQVRLVAKLLEGEIGEYPVFVTR
jgi:hypothetical protein